MKNLENLVGQEAIIVDTCAITESIGILCKLLYECSEFIHLSPEKTEKNLKKLITTKKFLLSKNIYVTPNILMEIQETLNILNQQQEFHKARKNGKIKSRRGKRFDSRLDEDDSNYDNTNQELLNNIADEVYAIKRYLEKRDITKKLSQDEREKITNMVAFFKTIRYSNGNSLKQDYSGRYEDYLLRSKQSLKLDTDEEIVASSIISASKFPVTIITRDSDIRRLIRVSLANSEFYNEFWQDFPRQRIKVITGYKNEDYKLVYDSDDISLC